MKSTEREEGKEEINMGSRTEDGRVRWKIRRVIRREGEEGKGGRREGEKRNRCWEEGEIEGNDSL